MKSEPVMIISTVVAIVLAALPHLPVFGVPIAPEQAQALESFLPSMVTLLGGVVARSYVSPANRD